MPGDPGLIGNIQVRKCDVIDVLSGACSSCAAFPSAFRSDNGPEFVAKAVQDWITRAACRSEGVLMRSRRSSPWENGFIESFNARLRDELLNGEIFYSLAEARIVVESWRRHYNRASEHPSVYAIELNKICWFWSGPAGRLVFRWARSAIDLAASVIGSCAREDLKGRRSTGAASIDSRRLLAASRTAFLGAIFRTCAASGKIEPGLDTVGCAFEHEECPGVRSRNEVTRSRGPTIAVAGFETVAIAEKASDQIVAGDQRQLAERPR